MFNNINKFLNKHQINHTNKVIVSSNNVLIEELDFNKINPTETERIRTFANDHYINEAGKFISELRVANNEIMEELGEDQESDEEKWYPKYHNCECCKGFVYKCKGLACANLGMCYCKMQEECDYE